jgi:hypothetical protein
VVVLQAKPTLQLPNTLAQNYGSYKIWQSAAKRTRKIKNKRLKAILNEQDPGREKYRNNITYRTL